MNSADNTNQVDIDPAKGLSQSEIESRLKKFGYNEVPVKKPNPVFRIFKNFWGLSAWMLELIIILSWVLHRYPDAYIALAFAV
jgi:H+-transporting ATPase